MMTSSQLGINQLQGSKFLSIIFFLALKCIVYAKMYCLSPSIKKTQGQDKNEDNMIQLHRVHLPCFCFAN
jgi:hypothetical protein